MARKDDHVVMRGEEMFCSHCGHRQKLTFPIDLNVFAAAAKAFTASHRECEPDPRVTEEEERKRVEATKSPDAWRRGPDTGISSITIWSVMTGRPHGLAGFGPDVPHDPADFGRCHRLLQAFPEWRVRLGEVVVRYPAWGPMIREWDRMTALYEREIQRQDGMAPELYELMQSLQDVARETASR